MAGTETGKAARIVAHYVFQPLTRDASDWGEIVVYSDGKTETYQVQRKGKDIGEPHKTYKAARAAMKAAA